MTTNPICVSYQWVKYFWISSYTDICADNYKSLLMTIHTSWTFGFFLMLFSQQTTQMVSAIPLNPWVWNI